MNRRDAVLKGVLGATQIHDKLGIADALDDGAEYIDVFKAIKDEGIFTLCRPLEGALGMFIPGERNGIIVSTNRKLPIQRYTAAHELGHYWLKHTEVSIDKEMIHSGLTDIVDSPQQEVEAEAFASEFLMPKQLLINIARKRRWKKKDFLSPEVVYQTSLRAGTSYEATCIALQQHDLIARDDARRLSITKPKTIKKGLLQEQDLDDPWADVHNLRISDHDSNLEIGDHDVVILELDEHSGGGYIWMDINEYKAVEVIASRSIQVDKSRLGGHTVRKLIFKGKGNVKLHLKEQRTWERNSIQAFNIEINFAGAENGLPRVCR